MAAAPDGVMRGPAPTIAAWRAPSPDVDERDPRGRLVGRPVIHMYVAPYGRRDEHAIRQDEDPVRAIVDVTLGGDADDWLRPEVV